jgi:probable phosphoglycerate mutase
MTTNLYLIRHGEAHSNVESVIGGMNGDQGLTERGVRQAQALAERLRGGEIKADVLYASTLPRARQTAEYVAEALGMPIIWDDELHELRPGQADGLQVEEARERFEGFNRFLHEAYMPIAPDGESWGTFQMRAAAALERLTTRHKDQTIVLVTHGGVIEVSFLHFLELGPQARRRLAFHARNTAITHWRRWESSGGRAEWQLIVHNDHYHLHALDAADAARQP